METGKAHFFKWSGYGGQSCGWKDLTKKVEAREDDKKSQ